MTKAGLTLILLMLAACAKEKDLDFSPLPDQGPAKERAKLYDDFIGCRYLDEVRDSQTLAMNGYDIQVLWGSLFINVNGVQSRVNGQSLDLHACRIDVFDKGHYEVIYE